MNQKHTYYKKNVFAKYDCKNICDGEWQNFVVATKKEAIVLKITKKGRKGKKFGPSRWSS